MEVGLAWASHLSKDIQTPTNLVLPPVLPAEDVLGVASEGVHHGAHSLGPGQLA